MADQKTVVLDDVGINASHYGAMEQEEAVNRIIKDGAAVGNNDDEKRAWAQRAYDLCKKAFEKKGKDVTVEPYNKVSNISGDIIQ